MAMLLQRHMLLVAALMLASSLPSRTAAAPPPKENEVKAVLLFHLTQFVTWPAATTNLTDFTIGVLGSDPFAGALEAVVRNEKIGDRPIVIERSRTAEELRDCEIVYISPDARESEAQIFRAFAGRSILTVGESNDFITNGGMIRFRRTPERKIRLQVHLPRVRERGLNISSQLLRVCDVLEGGPVR